MREEREKKNYPHEWKRENALGSVIHEVIHIIHKMERMRELSHRAYIKTDVLVSSTKTQICPLLGSPFEGQILSGMSGN